MEFLACVCFFSFERLGREASEKPPSKLVVKDFLNGEAPEFFGEHRFGE